MFRKQLQSQPHPVQSESRLLAQLPTEEFVRLTARMERRPLKLRDVLYEENRPIEYVHFPISGISSVLALMSDGSAVEVATVGNEGMVGVALLLGTNQTNGRSFQQVPGESWRMRAADFLQEISRGGSFPDLMRRYTQALFTQITQSTACNRLHPVEERLARWLLMTRDRVSSSEFPLPHEFLGQMLGVRRPKVTVVAGQLQNAGIIKYTRGKVTILDPEKLEEASCECYEVVKSEFERLLGIS